MDILESLLFLAALMLLFVVSLGALSAFSKILAQNPEAEEARRSQEGGCLILMIFLLILAVLIWRSS